MHAAKTLMDVSAGQKFFQLEEMEDKETSTTDLFLNRDGTVTVGETDGPIPKDARGEWSQKSDGTFRMTLIRSYEAGKEKTLDTDVGEFAYETERLFTGTEITMVGNCLSVSGSIHHMDEHGDQEVGYFIMIDTTKARLGEDDDDE